MAKTNPVRKTVEAAKAKRTTTKTPQGSRRFEGAIAFLSLWVLAGLFLDGWAHNTILDSIESFITPWHLVLYSGLAASSLVLGGAWLLNIRRGFAWTHALPAGYMLSLLGVLIFGLAGGLDFAWHSTFGFEVDTEALLSPPHLMLATGGLLLVTGPLRAAWHDPARKETWADLWPAIASAFVVLSILTFFTQFSNGFQHASAFTDQDPGEGAYYRQATTISYILIPSGLLMGILLMLMRRWTLPRGSFVLLIAGNALLMFIMGSSYSGEEWPVLLAALGGGIAAEALYATLRPSAERVREMRAFAFIVPFALFLMYLGVLIATGGIWWRIHMWLGAPVMAGALGLGLSYLSVPPLAPRG